MDNHTVHENKFTMGQLVNILWHRKWLIIIGTLLMTIIATLIIWLSPKTYSSSAVISVSEFHRINRAWEPSEPPPTGLSIPEFNNLLLIIKSQNKLEKFLTFNNYLEKDNESIGMFKWTIQPGYAFPRSNRRTNDKNFVVSLKVKAEANTPEKSRERAHWIGKYCMTMLLNFEIKSFFGSLKVNLDSSAETYGKRIYEVETSISGLKEKEGFIINNILKLDSGVNFSELDLKSINPRTVKYLPPKQQLVAVRMSIKEKELLLQNLKQKIAESEILADYIGKVYHLIDEDNNFLLKESLLDTLQKETDEYFTDETIKKEKGAYYRIAMSLFHFSKLKTVVYTFDTYPSRGVLKHQFRRKIVPIFTFFFSLFGFMFLALVMEWIKINKKEIMEDHEYKD